MTEQDYTSGLDYLLARLQEVEATDVINEINSGINRGKTLVVRDNADLKKNRIKETEVGKTQTLPLTSKEAFESAINYLSKIIIDVPSYADNIRSMFGVNVIWEYDQSQSVKLINTVEGFSLEDISFNENEVEKAKIEINNLKQYTNE